MRVTPTFLLETGATITTAKVEAMVDLSEVTELLSEDVDLSAAGLLVGSAYTAITPSVQVISGEPVAVFHTAASMYPTELYFGIAAGRHEMAVIWNKRSGPGTQVVVPGLPVWISRNEQVEADMATYQGQEIAAFHWIPLVTADPRLVYPHWTSTIGGGLRMLPQDPAFICRQAVTDSGYTKVCTLGFTDALVHYSLSSSFSPGDIYALYYSSGALSGAHRFMMPISWHGSNHSGATMSFLPYGLIRQVFTDSGVTNVAMPLESTTYSLASQPFYVARIWFWGRPCL